MSLDDARLTEGRFRYKTSEREVKDKLPRTCTLHRSNSCRETKEKAMRVTFAQLRFQEHGKEKRVKRMMADGGVVQSPQRNMMRLCRRTTSAMCRISEHEPSFSNFTFSFGNKQSEVLMTSFSSLHWPSS